MTNPSHTELAAQARELVLLANKFGTRQFAGEIVECLRRCAAALESPERGLGELPEHCTSGNCPCIKCPRATPPTAPAQDAQGVESIRRLVADDAYAMSFQTMGQYRSALLKACSATPSPQAEKQPLSDEWIRSMCKQGWVFDTVKQWVRVTEAAHGIGVAK